MSRWEEKWKLFKEASWVEDPNNDCSSKKLEYSKSELDQLYASLPDMLYHITSREVAREIKKQGFLGFKYDDSYKGARGYQPSGWGVFLATEPDLVDLLGSGPATAVAEDDGSYVTFKVPKSCLDSNKISVDEDQHVTSKEDSVGKQVSLVDVVRRGKAIYYADKIPLSQVKTKSTVHDTYHTSEFRLIGSYLKSQSIKCTFTKIGIGELEMNPSKQITNLLGLDENYSQVILLISDDNYITVKVLGIPRWEPYKGSVDLTNFGELLKRCKEITDRFEGIVSGSERFSF